MVKRFTYKKSGVDIKKANAFVQSIKKLAASTQTEKFGSLFPFDIKKYQEPILVSSADGVGTKLLIANAVNRHDTVGIDVVAMNVNDIVCVGARPLFFLDYIACGKLNNAVLTDVMRGIVIGCAQAGCALVGGETAEMPGMYTGDDYDLAGFTVGVVERNKIIDSATIEVGDYVIGIASSGLHSNGFSLVRNVLSRREQKKLASVLLTPTRIYVKPVLALLARCRVKGIAHITGGAFYEKLAKIIPDKKCCRIDSTRWPIPDIFLHIQRTGNIAKKEMFATLNMGIGMTLVVSPNEAANAVRFLAKHKLQSWVIGEIIHNQHHKIIV